MPDDMSFVGYCGHEEVLEFSSSITSVELPMGDIGVAIPELIGNGTHRMRVYTGTYDPDTGATIPTDAGIVAEDVLDVQFSAPTIYADVEMAVTFTDRTVNYSASRHN